MAALAHDLSENVRLPPPILHSQALSSMSKMPLIQARLRDVGSGQEGWNFDSWWYWGRADVSPWVRDEVCKDFAISDAGDSSNLSYWISILKIWNVILSTSRNGDETWQAKRVMERIKSSTKKCASEGENRRWITLLIWWNLIPLSVALRRSTSKRTFAILTADDGFLEELPVLFHYLSEKPGKKDALYQLVPQEAIRQCSAFLLFVGDLNRASKGVRMHTDQFHPEGPDNLLITSVDAALAGQNTLLAAESSVMEVSHWFGSVWSSWMAKLFNLPDYTYPVFGMALGVPNQNHPIAFSRLFGSCCLRRKLPGADPWSTGSLDRVHDYLCWSTGNGYLEPTLTLNLDRKKPAATAELL